MGKNIWEKIKYWGQLFLLPIYWLSFLMPRSKKIWAFGSTFGRRFADNPRYFYLYTSNNCKDIKSVWISHDKELVEFLNKNKYEAYYYHSLKGIWYALRAKVFFFDNYSKDINFWQSGGALKFNMWHGVPLKKIQADNIHDYVRHPKSALDKIKYFPRRLSDEKPSHYVLATSEFMKPIFASAFVTKKVSTAGYPRIDSFAYDNIASFLTETEKNDVEKIKQYKKENQNLKVAYYMPTFRDSETKFFDVIDTEKFQSFLEKNNILLVTKLHPKSKLRKEFRNIAGKNILNVDQDTDPYVFISVSDMLITDYSSIYFDYLFTGKPIIFFDYDLDEYLNDSREMYFEYEEYTPGEKATNQAELEDALLRVINSEDNYINARKNLQKKMFDNTEKPVCENIVNEVKAIIG